MYRALCYFVIFFFVPLLQHYTVGLSTFKLPLKKSLSGWLFSKHETIYRSTRSALKQNKFRLLRGSVSENKTCTERI